MCIGMLHVVCEDIRYLYACSLGFREHASECFDAHSICILDLWIRKAREVSEWPLMRIAHDSTKQKFSGVLQASVWFWTSVAWLRVCKFSNTTTQAFLIDRRTKSECDSFRIHYVVWHCMHECMWWAPTWRLRSIRYLENRTSNLFSSKTKLDVEGQLRSTFDLWPAGAQCWSLTPVTPGSDEHWGSNP